MTITINKAAGRGGKGTVIRRLVAPVSSPHLGVASAGNSAEASPAVLDHAPGPGRPSQCRRMQRKPTWLVEVSTGSGWRAAGR